MRRAITINPAQWLFAVAGLVILSEILASDCRAGRDAFSAGPDLAAPAGFHVTTPSAEPPAPPPGAGKGGLLLQVDELGVRLVRNRERVAYWQGFTRWPRHVPGGAP